MQAKSGGAGVSPLDVVWILWRRRWLLLTVVGIGMSSAVAATALLPRVYAARAAVLIEARLEPSPDGSGGVVPILPDSATIDSLVQVLGSRSMARQVIDAKELALDHELNPSESKGWLPSAFAAQDEGSPVDTGLVDRFLSRLAIDREGKSHAIAVTFSSSDPQQAAAVANALAERFVADRMELRQAAQRRAAANLGDHLNPLQLKLDASQAALRAARLRLGPATADATTLAGQVAQLRRELAAAAADRAGRETRLSRVRKRVHEQGVEAAIGDAASPLLNSLQAMKAENVRREAETRAQYGARHPKLVGVRAERVELEAKIEHEQLAVLDQQAEDTEGARAREWALRVALVELEKRVVNGTRASVELQGLEQQSELDGRLYESQLARVKGAPEPSASPIADVRIISEATPPTVAVFPRPEMMLTAGFTASLLIGLFAVYATEQSDRRLRTPDDVRSVLGLPTIGLIPELPRRAARKVPLPDWALQHPGSRESESVRALLTSLQSGPEDSARVVMLTSSVPSEGKSSLALALGRTAAEEGLRTLLIDADLRRPSIATMLGRPAGLGLAELAAGRVGLDEVMIDDMRSQLRIIPGSATGGPPVGLMGDAGVAAVIAKARESYDLVIVDTAPLLPVSDTARLAPLADRVVFALRWGHTAAPLAKQAIEQLAGAQLAGVVLTRVDLAKHRAWATGDSGLAYARYRNYYVS